MAQIPFGMHQCPTRIDGAAVRFAHTVHVPMCQERQRDHYHKCFTCVHNNRHAGELGAPGFVNGYSAASENGAAPKRAAAI